MDFNRSNSFDELKPRVPPAPECFAAVPFSSTVPEVSLVFSPLPLTETHLNKKSPLQTSNNFPNSLASNRVVTENQLRDIAYHTLQNEGLGERYNATENVLHSSAKIEAKTGFMNDKSIRKQNVNVRKTVPSVHVPDPSGAHRISYLQDVCVDNSHQLAPNYERHSTQFMNAPMAFRNCSYSTASRALSMKATDVNDHTDLHVSQIAANHCQGNVIHSGQIFGKPQGCGPSRLHNSPAAVSFDYYSCGKQQCCSNHNKCVLAQDMINSRSTSSGHDPPVNSKTQHPLSHSCKYGPCCAYNMPCIESKQEFDNQNVHNGQFGRYLNTQMNVTSKCKEYNRHFFGYNENESVKRNIHPEENIILVNAKQKEHKFKEKLETNVCNSKNVLFTEGSSGHDADLEGSCANVQQDAWYKKKCDRMPKSLPDSPGKQNDRKCTDTSILQEIALMNHKQCSILQGLLQQVVVMQADQMKILGEINEKLRNRRIPEDAIPNKHENSGTSSNIFSKKEDAATQTIINEKVDFWCQKSDVGGEIGISDINSSKKSCINPTDPVNAEIQNMTSPLIEGGHENEQSKTRRLQDRAVSWSAVHGVETVEESFTLHGVCVPTVVEQLPSSIHTMHLHVQDYHSSASFDSIKESRFINDGSFETGKDVQKGSWTLYDNIVGHVKKFLKTVPCENGCSTQKSPQVEAIRFATIEKIRQLGVSVYENSAEIKEVNVPEKINFDSNAASRSPYPDSTPAEKSRSDASMELQALALKYLQDEDLSDLVKWNQSSKTPSILKPGQKSANISLATQHYLEKYKLLPIGSDSKEKWHNNENYGHICIEDNILDITTLKKQPKLL